MKKIYLGLGMLLIFAASAHSQVVRIDTLTRWQKKLVTNLNFNQASFSSNWTAGGINSFGLNSLFNYKVNYNTDKISWNNEFDLIYGFVNNSGQGYRKNIDRIFLDTKLGRKLNDKWNLFSSLNFLSQFSRGYKYDKDVNGVEEAKLISDIFAPAFITSAWGLEYTPASYFKVRISPFAPRVTIVNDPERFIETVGPSPYGVEPGETARFEWLAFQAMADFNKDIATNLNLKWRYLIFANYETLDMKTIDHRLDLMFSVQAGKYITMGAGGILLYDFDQDSGAQVSQVFNVGVSYTFRNYEEK
jgi:hypothetical protein